MMTMLLMTACSPTPSEPDVPSPDEAITLPVEEVEIIDEVGTTYPAEEPTEQEEEVDAFANEDKPTQSPAQILSSNEVTEINGNIPNFTNADLTSTETYHTNGNLDAYGRVTAANAVVGVEIMPASGTRGDISGTTPTGWNQARYADIGAGGWLYNRSHLIGHQMTGNDSPRNLMTGTRWFNMAMLEYENYVADYVERTENHVRYRITPVFEGTNMLASGIYMEGFSIEDNGEGLSFHIYVPNVQPDVEIDYATGKSSGKEGPVEAKDAENIVPYNPGKSTVEDAGQYIDSNGQGTIKGSNSGIYHVPGSSYYDKTTNPKEMFKSISEAEAAGYRAPKR